MIEEIVLKTLKTMYIMFVITCWCHRNLLFGVWIPERPAKTTKIIAKIIAKTSTNWPPRGCSNSLVDPPDR